MTSNTALAIVFCALVALVVKVFIRKQSNPNTTLLLCIVDTLSEIPQLLGIGPWGRDNTINGGLAAAIQRTGLTDLGPSTDNYSFIKRYEVARKGMAVSGIKHSPVGYLISSIGLSARMEIRLKLIDYIKKHPSVEAVKLKPPIFVIGLTRTGTTFLHELLGLHEDVKMHYTWEQFDPIPRTDSESLEARAAERKMRYNGSKIKFAVTLMAFGEKIQSIHRIGYDEPEECTTPCCLELPWLMSELPFTVFVADELLKMGAGDAFKYYEKLLKLFTWQADDRMNKDFTWMLKCPFHLPYLTELNATFPDSTIVWTHRDPSECIASACSLYETLISLGCEESSIDKKALGRAVVNYSKLCIKMAEDTIAALGIKFKIVHVRYADNVRNSKNVCRQICEKADLPFSAEYSAKVDHYLQQSSYMRKMKSAKKENKKVHSYSIEEYGLSVELVQKEFAEYIAKYDLLDSNPKAK